MISQVQQQFEPVQQATNGHAPRNGAANILIVDDREDKLLALEAILAEIGGTIVKVRSGKEALRQLLQRDFSVILLDVSMPMMDGFETAAMIRKRPRNEHTPIIFITSLSCSENQIARGYALGAVDYILSPIVADVLRTKVSVFVELHRRAEEARRQAERIRQMQALQHRRELAEVIDRLESETQRNRFFTLAIDMLAIADFSGRLLQMNPTWQKTLGFSEQELMARSGLDLVHPEDHAGLCEHFDRLRGGETVYFEARFRCKDGSYRWLGWTAAPFVSERLLYIFARDITARKVSEAEIRALNGELSRRVADLTRINEELEAFSYSISHDLRAPLRATHNFALALLEDCIEELSDTGKDYARRIMSSAAYMDMLIHDLLDYSLLSRMPLTPGKMSLDHAVAEVVLHSDKEIREKEAVVEMCRPFPDVLAYPPVLRQILSNLLGNALKFVPDNRKPKVRIRTEQNGKHVRIWIEDNGIGISPEHQEKIFGLFNRLHPKETYPGTGIGLALVQKGVQRMNGSAGVESESGTGSRFWIDLPAAQ